MTRRWGMILSLLAASTVAVAGGPKAVRDQARSSMLVTGSVNIEPDGHVAQVVIDDPDALPSGIVDLVNSAVPEWRFEPVVIEGQPARVRAPMTLRVIAQKNGDDGYDVQIQGATFGGDDRQSGEFATSLNMSPPRYPTLAVKYGVQGTVFVVVQVARDGTVQDVLAEQTNLRVVASEGRMQTFRGMLEQATLAAARGWTFQPPTRGANVADDYWLVRVPVAYSIDGPDGPYKLAYGEWQSYIPGPRQALPWSDRDGRRFGGTDALAAGTVHQLGAGPRLLTPLDAPKG